jgi:CelD/BcsL family acetyltransferase involved in cellulose biosynthesis
MSLAVTALLTVEDFERLGDEWDALEASLSPRTPFTSRGWNTLWWQHFRRDGWLKRDELRAFAVRRPDGRLVAVAPMMRTVRPAVGPWRSRELQFFGADPNMTEIRGMVCRPEDQVKAAAALMQHLRQRSNEWDWIGWSGMRQEPSRSAEWAGSDLRWTRQVPSFYLPMPSSWNEFRTRLPRNIKESLRKCYNSLKRDGLDFEFRVVTQPADTDAAVERFLQLHAVRSHSTDGVAHEDVFGSERAKLFLRDYCRFAAGRDQLRVFQMRIGGNVVATRIGFALGRELYLYYSGYDIAWSKYSVMTTLVAEALKWSIDNGHRIVNLSTGKDVSKTRWRPEVLTHRDALVQAPRWRARVTLRASQILLPRTRGMLADEDEQSPFLWSG